MRGNVYILYYLYYLYIFQTLCFRSTAVQVFTLTGRSYSSFYPSIDICISLQGMCVVQFLPFSIPTRIYKCMLCSFLERSRPEPAGDVQTQVLHSEENRLHWQAFLLWYWSGGEVCDFLYHLAVFPKKCLFTYMDWKHTNKHDIYRDSSPKIWKYIFFSLTCRAVYPSRLLCCELLSFWDIGLGDVSFRCNTIELDGTLS